MESKEMNRLRYNAPEMKAAGFRAEQGYAVSENPGTTANTKITMQGGNL